jgi:hypothetical protein
MTLYRKLEALMGHDADEAPTDLMDQLQNDAREFGSIAAQELAANLGRGSSSLLSAALIKDIARTKGSRSSPQDRVRGAEEAKAVNRSNTPAWKLGADSARFLRKQESLGSRPIGNDCLAAMMGTVPQTLQRVSERLDAFAFALDEPDLHNPIVLRARGETGRRFELARLLGDYLMPGDAKKLYPATGTDTYQQRLQRAFAAELLCPFETVRDMLNGDYSDENMQEVAHHFQVSDLTVRTQLVNNDHLERSALDDERFALAA